MVSFESIDMPEYQPRPPFPFVSNWTGETCVEGTTPINFVSNDDPPLLLLHGDRDLTVPLQQSNVLKAKYEETGLPVELVVHKGGGHSWWPGIMTDYRAVWSWFDKYLRLGRH